MEVAILEIAKIGLQLFFTSARLSGKSEEEIKELFNSEKETFDKNVPSYLPDA